MSEFAEDFLQGRLARAVEAVQGEALPVAALERSLSRARSIEPRSGREPAGGKKDLWRNRISSLFDQLEDRDLLSAAPLCCVSPADLPTSSVAVDCGAKSVRERRGAAVLAAPAIYAAGGEVWEEALAGLWSDEEELAVGSGGADWIASSTACADWTWSG